MRKIFNICLLVMAVSLITIKAQAQEVSAADMRVQSVTVSESGDSLNAGNVVYNDNDDDRLPALPNVLRQMFGAVFLTRIQAITMANEACLNYHLGS